MQGQHLQVHSAQSVRCRIQHLWTLCPSHKNRNLCAQWNLRCSQTAVGTPKIPKKQVRKIILIDNVTHVLLDPGLPKVLSLIQTVVFRLQHETTPTSRIQETHPFQKPFAFN